MDRNLRDSQNFLRDSSLVQMLIDNSNLTKDDVVYEIGPGKGIITDRLILKCKKVIAIEYDSKLARKLIEKYKGISNIEIINQDFMKVQLPSRKYKFFSNIPFNITADIMTKVLALDGVRDIYFIMQYEAFLKYAGLPYYKECLKSLLYKPFFDTDLVYEFVPTDFSPTPNAKIVFARFTPKSSPDIELKDKVTYCDFIAFIFTEKGQSFKEKSKKILSYEQIKRVCKNNGFFPDTPINELNYKQWLAFFNIYLDYVSSEKKANVVGAYSRLSETQSKLSKVHRNRNRNRN